MTRRLAALVLALAAIGGCSGGDAETTMLIQVTTSTLVVPDDVDELAINVVGVESMTMADQMAPISSLPQSYLVRATSNPNQDVTITVTARRAGAFAIRRVVHSRFVEGTNVVVVVELERDCVGMMCLPGDDCVRGVCEGIPDGGPMDGNLPDIPCIVMGAETCDGIDNDCNGTVDDTFDLQTDDQNCGRCGNVCGALPNGTNTCQLGTCTLICDASRADCDGIAADGCEADLSVSATCGACGTACSGATPACQMSAVDTYACVSGCSDPTPTLCSGSCVDVTSSPSNCGACDMACPTPPNTIATCTTSLCGTMCRSGFDDCDMVAGNGCEADLGTSVASCGACANACALPNATPACTGGLCTVATCEAGFANCDMVADNGCETPLDTLGDCGGCGVPCARAQATADCAGGVCTLSTCNAGFGDCDLVTANGCETPLTTLVNCGACGSSCSRVGATGTCATGACAIGVCNPGFGNCDANDANGCETSLATTTDCAACSVACVRANALTSCAGGTCRMTTCAAGYGDCDLDPANGCETPFNTLTDCGSCGTPCTVTMGNPSCTTGTCLSTGCRPGYGDCDMSLANGCETSLDGLANCGACGTVCAPANAVATCAGSNCRVVSCAAGFGDCDLVASNGCETPLTTLANCGACGTACSRSNGTASCATGTCALGACNSGFGNCDGNASNGCEATLTTLTNCSGCGLACARSNATPTCAAGACQIASCNAGFDDCDAMSANGCETSLSTLASCGMCGAACSRANATASCSTGSCTLLACNTGFGNCNLGAANGCEAPLTTATNCGTCGTPCVLTNAASSCATGSCVLGTCNPGFDNCDLNTANGCEAPLTTLANCGMCGAGCARANASASCATGMCALGACNPGFGNCDAMAANGCEAALTTATHCGACGVACSRANATASCGTGSCQIVSCNAGFGNCDANDANGCETPLNSLTSCGACGAACSRSNATATCATGSCAIASCNAGSGNCDATDANGCETSLTTATNCATCGTTCSRANASASCATGACVLGACNPLSGNCDGNAVNGCETPLTTLTNCASCGTICDIGGSGETCASGICTPTTCSPGFGDCDGNMANGCEQALNTLTHCGACMTSCARTNASATCSTGSCAISSCNPTFGNCDATDANGCEASLTSLTSCGSCGTVCSRANATETCATGTCAIASCNPSFGNCDAMDATGCETSLATLTNCGGCGMACARANATPTCSSGSCAVSSCNVGFANCDFVDGNGCETSLTTLANCASCGTTCSAANATATCATGTCGVGSCNPGFGNCDGLGSNGCETSLTTLTNCSTCGTACSRANAAATCGSGSCAIASCNAGFGNCDAMDSTGCEAALTSLTNCGGCGVACARASATATCATGSCAISACSPGFGSCDSIDSNGCEVALTSTTNCGTCGTPCSRTNATATCATGSCAIASCNAGFGDCDGNSFTGCEQQLNAVAHCGACNTACTRANASATCATGSCAISACNPGFGNCDAVDSNGCESLVSNFYRDLDGDTYGAGAVTQACTAPVGYVANNTDCNDGDAAVNPGHAEVCGNGLDDNCVGGIDEGCVAGACPGSLAVPLPGGRFTVTLGANAQTGTCGGAGSEAYLAFAVTAVSDAFITTLGGGIDTVVYVRSTTCAGAEVGCNDDADGATASSLHLTGLPIGTYHVFVDTKVPMSANVSVDIYVADAAPASDRCSNPTFIPAATANIAGTTCGFASDYSASTGQGDCTLSGVGADADRVYYFYLPVARAVTFNGCQGATVYDTTAYVRSVCTTAGLAAQRGCNDDGCSGAAGCGGSFRSTLTTAVLPAGLYYFFADGYGGGSCPCGAYQFNLTGI